MITESQLQLLLQWSQGSQRRILGITGLPGAGKSTLADWIKQQLGESVALLPMDGFHMANNQLQRLGRSQRKGAPDTFDVPGYQATLERVRKALGQQTVYTPAFHREIEESIAGEIAIEPQVKLIITEGNYLLYPQQGWQHIAPLLDQCWFVEVDEQRRLQQLTARHMQFGRSADEARKWIETTDQVNAEIIRKTAKFATAHITLEQSQLAL